MEKRIDKRLIHITSIPTFFLMIFSQIFHNIKKNIPRLYKKKTYLIKNPELLFKGIKKILLNMKITGR